MAKKSRYKAYLEGAVALQKENKQKREIASTKSVIGKLKLSKGRK